MGLLCAVRNPSLCIFRKSLGKSLPLPHALKTKGQVTLYFNQSEGQFAYILACFRKASRLSTEVTIIGVLHLRAGVEGEEEIVMESGLSLSSSQLSGLQLCN